MSQYTYWSNYLVTKFEVNCSFIIKLANMYIISFFFLKIFFLNQEWSIIVDTTSKQRNPRRNTWTRSVDIAGSIFLDGVLEASRVSGRIRSSGVLERKVGGGRGICILGFTRRRNHNGPHTCVPSLRRMHGVPCHSPLPSFHRCHPSATFSFRQYNSQSH